MQTEELRRFLGRRIDGYWEMLATSVGHAEAIVKTERGLSSDALDAGFHGLASAPSVIDLRIQALAAYDGKRLVRLSRTWKRPSELRCSVVDTADDAWLTAWSSSLRFLVAEGECAGLAGPLPRPVRLELDVVCGEPKGVAPGSWEQLIEVVHGLEPSGLRAIDHHQLHLPEVVDRRELVALLGSDRPTDEEIRRVRILQKHTHRLGPSARDLLAEMAYQKWAELEDPSTDAGTLILMEIALQGSASEDMACHMRDLLVARLKGTDGPRLWATFAYLLAGTHWRCA